MKKRLILASLAIVFAVSSSLVGGTPLEALTNQKLETIKSNCSLSQITLKQIQMSDLATRISRGRDYQDLIKLMANFNARLALNKINGGNLTAYTADLKDQFNDFQNNFIKYSDQISSMLKLDCEKQPAEFYSQLEKARQLRLSLAEQTAKMSTTLDNYHTGVMKVAKSMKGKS